MNICTFTGRITKDLEIRSTSGGAKYCRFTLAVSRGKVKDGQQSTDFIPCAAWNKTAEILVNYARKGQMIGITGRLAAQQYEKDGEKKTSYEVLVNSLDFLGIKTQDEAPRSQPTEPTEPTEESGNEELDLPFPINDL